MKSYPLTFASLLVVITAPLLSMPALADGRGQPDVFSPHSHPYGRSYREWTAAWWKWLLSIPLPSNPLFDDTGEDAAVAQSGPVWFLSGATSPGVVRNVTIPKGRALLFPIINVNNDYPCPDPNFHPSPGQSLAAFLTFGNESHLGARDYMDQVSELRVEIDGRVLRDPFEYRATSPLFWFDADPSLVGPNWDPCLVGGPQQGVSDGFWVMVKPLEPGKHTIKFRGAGPWTQDVTYRITVTRRGD